MKVATVKTRVSYLVENDKGETLEVTIQYNHANFLRAYVVSLPVHYGLRQMEFSNGMFTEVSPVDLPEALISAALCRWRDSTQSVVAF